MTRRIIQTDNAPAPVGPYNQAIAAGGELVFIAGQIALDPKTMTLVGDTVADQMQQVMANIAAILQAAGLGWEHVVKTTVFLKDMNDFAEMNRVYATYFDEASAPARAAVEVARLPKDALVEVECIAALTI